MRERGTELRAFFARPAPILGCAARAAGQEWLLIEWPEDETEPTKYWFSTLSEDVAFDRLIDLTKLRWRIERDYQELKQELGLGDYEGRGWRGFHHHATLCIAAYGFLIAERGAIPPSGPPSSPQLSRSAIPQGYRPRGAADPTRTPHPEPIAEKLRVSQLLANGVEPRLPPVST